MRSRALLPFSALPRPPPAGCGRNAEERQLDAMREEIENVRQSRDRTDHAGNAGDTAEPPPVVPQAYASAAQVGPPPAVVQLGADGRPGDDTAEGDPQDTTPRPTIRVL